jgi:hypothetical protein
MKIVVRKRHIQQGVGSCGGSATCPIALAINEQTKFKAQVGWSATFLTSADGRTKTLLNTEKMKSFIDKFDNGKSVRPFSFNIDI